MTEVLEIIGFSILIILGFANLCGIYGLITNGLGEMYDLFEHNHIVSKIINHILLLPCAIFYWAILIIVGDTYF